MYRGNRRFVSDKDWKQRKLSRNLTGHRIMDDDNSIAFYAGGTINVSNESSFNTVSYCKNNDNSLTSILVLLQVPHHLLIDRWLLHNIWLQYWWLYINSHILRDDDYKQRIFNTNHDDSDKYDDNQYHDDDDDDDNDDIIRNRINDDIL